MLFVPLSLQAENVELKIGLLVECNMSSLQLEGNGKGNLMNLCLESLQIKRDMVLLGSWNSSSFSGQNDNVKFF